MTAVDGYTHHSVCFESENLTFVERVGNLFCATYDKGFSVTILVSGERFDVKEHESNCCTYLTWFNPLTYLGLIIRYFSSQHTELYNKWQASRLPPPNTSPIPTPTNVIPPAPPTPAPVTTTPPTASTAPVEAPSETPTTTPQATREPTPVEPSPSKGGTLKRVQFRSTTKVPSPPDSIDTNDFDFEAFSQEVKDASTEELENVLNKIPPQHLNKQVFIDAILTSFSELDEAQKTIGKEYFEQFLNNLKNPETFFENRYVVGSLLQLANILKIVPYDIFWEELEKNKLVSEAVNKMGKESSKTALQALFRCLNRSETPQNLVSLLSRIKPELLTETVSHYQQEGQFHLAELFARYLEPSKLPIWSSVFAPSKNDRALLDKYLPVIGYKAGSFQMKQEFLKTYPMVWEGLESDTLTELLKLSAEDFLPYFNVAAQNETQFRELINELRKNKPKLEFLLTKVEYIQSSTLLNICNESEIKTYALAHKDTFFSECGKLITEDEFRHYTGTIVTLSGESDEPILSKTAILNSFAIQLQNYTSQEEQVTFLNKNRGVLKLLNDITKKQKGALLKQCPIDETNFVSLLVHSRFSTNTKELARQVATSRFYYLFYIFDDKFQKMMKPHLEKYLSDIEKSKTSEVIEKIAKLLSLQQLLQGNDLEAYKTILGEKMGKVLKIHSNLLNTAVDNENDLTFVGESEFVETATE